MPPMKKKVLSRRSESSRDELPTEPSKSAVSLKDYIIMFFGPPGVGKTTIVNELADRVLFLSTDRGTRFMSAMRLECLDWNQCKARVKALGNGNAKKLYDIIAVDHVDDIANMAEQWVLRELGIRSLADEKWGKGWSMLKKELNTFVTDLKRLDVGIVFISHEITKTVKVNGLEIDKCMPDISKQSWKIIVPLADLVGYCTFRRVKGDDGKAKEIRVLETTPRLDLYCKDRTDRKRPDRDWEPLDGRKFVKTFGE